MVGCKQSRAHHSQFRVLIVVSRRVYILVAVFLLAGAAGAQTSMQHLTRAQIDSIMNPTLHADAGDLLLVDKASYDIGKLSEADSPVTRDFLLRNVSDSPLRILRVRTTCGCTVSTFDTVAIAPGDAAKVSLTYNPKNRPGTIDVDGFVYLEGYERQPMARLSLYGEVLDSDVWRHLPQAMGTLRLKRKEVHFTELPPKGETTMRVLCANSGTKPLKLTSKILPPYAALHTEPAVIAPGEEADLVVTIDVDRLPSKEGDIRASLIVDGVAGKPSERTLQIMISR